MTIDFLSVVCIDCLKSLCVSKYTYEARSTSISTIRMQQQQKKKRQTKLYGWIERKKQMVLIYNLNFPTTTTKNTESNKKRMRKERRS